MSENFVERQIILGAGASDGYPLGEELMELIIFLGNDGMIAGKVESERVTFYNKIKLVAQDLKICKPNSIDYYAMRLDKERHNILKSLIIATIESHEPYQQDLEQGKIDTWYGNLLPLLFPEGLGFSENKLEKIENHLKEKENSLKIITFNYDISLERYIHNFLKTNIFPNAEDSLNKAKKIIFEKIFHVYGSISNDVEVDSALLGRGCVKVYDKRLHYAYDEDEKVGMGKQVGFKKRNLFYKKVGDDCWSFKVLRRAYEIYEKKFYDSIKLIERGHDVVKVSQCKYLYILGFGFDPLNLDNIGLDHEKGSSFWREKCFITKFGEYPRINRLAKDHLCGDDKSKQDCLIISDLNIKNSLNHSFYLTEGSYDVSVLWDQLL